MHWIGAEVMMVMTRDVGYEAAAAVAAALGRMATRAHRAVCDGPTTEDRARRMIAARALDVAAAAAAAYAEALAAAGEV